MPNSIPTSLAGQIAAIPKAETHVHFLGVVRLPDQQEHSCDTISVMPLHTFIREYYRRRELIQRPSDLYVHASRYLHDAHHHGVHHVEFTLALPLFLTMPVEDIFLAFKAAYAEAARNYGMSGGLVIDLMRDTGPTFATQLLDVIAQNDQNIVVGIGLGGSESSAPAAAFSDVFERARAYNFRTSVHVGEQLSGTIYDTIMTLRPDRVEHATMIFKEPNAVNLLAKTQTPITVCLSSNERLGVVGRGEHPLRDMLESGLNVSLHTDDPEIFSCCLTDEYCKAHDDYGIDLETLKIIATQSFQSCFYTEST